MSWQGETSWFECAPSPMNEDDRPQSVDSAEDFINNFDRFRKDVWRRFVITRSGRQKFVNWVKSSWFFFNFSEEQIERIDNLTIRK